MDKLWDVVTGAPAQKGGTYHTGAEDVVFNFDRDYVKPAIEHWTPKKGSFIGDEGSGAVAQGLGGGAEMLTYGRRLNPTWDQQLRRWAVDGIARAAIG